MENPPTTQPKKWIYMILCILFGSAANYALKLQNTTTSMLLIYDHPLIQCTLIFLSQLVCLYMSCAAARNTPLTVEYDSTGLIKSPAKIYVFFFPALLDVIGYIAYTYGLVFCSLSISQVTGGSLLVFTGFFSFLCLKKQMHSYHVISMLMVTMGVALSIVGVTVFRDKEKPNENYILGILLILGANLIWSFKYMVEENFFSKYQVNSLQSIGYEGLLGLVYMIIILLVCQFIKCDPIYVGSSKSGFCIYNKVEDSAMALKQMRDNYILLFSSIGLVVVEILLNVCSIKLIEYGNAIHSCVQSNVSIVVLWVISLVYKWEAFNWIELIGFVGFVAFGSFIYHELIMMPIFGMHKKDAKYSLADNEIEDP